jgi:predicted DNA-binding protein
MKKIPVGTEFYKKKGLEKAITIHLPKELHARLYRLAKSEERSLQITVRRILEERLKGDRP